MSLIDDLAGVESRPSPYPGPRCTVALILAQISDDERGSLTRLIDNPTVPGSRIAEALTKNGYEITDKTVLRHRKRGTSTGCRCSKVSE